jgi:hypothetical protein
MKKRHLLSLTALFFCVCLATPVEAQYVAVTMQFDSSTIAVGGTTTLHVFAQVVPAYRANSERIFSWYVDMLNGSPAVAQADYSQLQKPTSDNYPPPGSSSGTTQGSDRRGIYDSFINDTPISKSGTGVNTKVELFSVPVQGLSAGQTTFRVTAGSGTVQSADFMVATTGGGALIGGVYDAATAVLQVSGSAPCTPTLSAAYARIPAGNNRVILSFSPCPGRTNVVEYRNSLNAGTWQALPGAPHNSGSVTDTNSVTVRFYRVRVSP